VDESVKTADEMRKQAMLMRIDYWYMRDCSLCGYPLAYLFFQDPHEVIFDAGCDCVRNMKKYVKSWDTIADQYNSQIDLNVIKNMNDFWGFDNA
jgi:hypothetical protein